MNSLFLLFDLNINKKKKEVKMIINKFLNINKKKKKRDVKMIINKFSEESIYSLSPSQMEQATQGGGRISTHPISIMHVSIEPKVVNINNILSR